MPVQDVVQILGGMIVGGLLAWLVASRRVRVMFQAEITDAKRRAARAVESAKNQIAVEMERTQHEASSLRTRLDEERTSAEATQSRLQADVIRLQQERAKLEARAAELEQKVNDLRAELHGANEESLRELERLHEVLNDFSGAVEQMESRMLAVSRRVKELATSLPRPG